MHLTYSSVYAKYSNPPLRTPSWVMNSSNPKEYKNNLFSHKGEINSKLGTPLGDMFSKLCHGEGGLELWDEINRGRGCDKDFIRLERLTQGKKRKLQLPGDMLLMVLRECVPVSACVHSTRLEGVLGITRHCSISSMLRRRLAQSPLPLKNSHFY